MVYCGMPSKGCKTCRDRRIKCDETKPICNQCIKSRRDCKGYRSDFDILHRDETQATETRAKRTAVKKAAKRAADGRGPGGGGGGGAFLQFEAAPHPKASKKATKPVTAARAAARSAATSPASTALTVSSAHTSPLAVGAAFPAAAPALPLDQHASHYFAANFIMLPGDGKARLGHLDFLVPILRTETNADSAFQLAYAACGLAAMSNREKAMHTNLVELAYMQHARALQAVAGALSDPQRCKSDATLAAVLLLAYFENITASKEAGLRAWRSHIEGAIHIVQQRGAEMFTNKYSLALFGAVRLRIIARTLSSGTAPIMGANWWTKESSVVDPYGAQFQRYALEISEIRAEVTRLMAVLPRQGHGMDHMLEMLRKTQGLDRDIANWLASLPPQYHPTTLFYAADDDDDINNNDDGIPKRHRNHAAMFPGGRVDTYQDLATAVMFNGVRASRIILGSLIIRVAAWICSPEDYRRTPAYATAVGTITANIVEIAASVSFSLGSLPPAHGKGATGGRFVCGSDEQAKMVGGTTIAWPLSTIRTCDFTTDAQREWAVERLNYIAHGLGIRYASTLADCKIRFPSMLIRQDGLLSSQDPLKELKKTLPTRGIAAKPPSSGA